MQFYAERPIRRAAQLVSDLLAVLLVIFVTWLGMNVYDQVLRLQAPGNGLVDAGDGLRGTFDSAANSVTGVPLLGDALAKALHGGSGVGTKLSDAGRWQIEAAENLAWWMAALIIAVPLLALLVTWLPLRWRFVRGATAAARLRDLGDEGLDLLALRAIATHALPRSAKAGNFATGWRDRDPDVLAELAQTELARHGLAPAVAAAS